MLKKPTKPQVLTIIKKYLFRLILALIIFALGWYYWQYQQKQQPTITYISPTRENIESNLTISGKIDAKKKAQLSFVAGGKLTSIQVKEGDLVSKGQNIASIDQATLQKQLEQNLNTYMQERYNFENLQDNIKDRALDTQEHRLVAQRQYDLNNRVLNVEIQKIAINNTILTAPFNGLITTTPRAVIGVYLMPNDYFELIDPDSLIFRATIDEIDLNLIKKGQKATISLDAYDQESINTHIDYIAYNSLEGNRGTVFIVEFPLNHNNIEKYRLGMNGDVTIKLQEKKNVLTLPLEYVYEKDGQKYVWLKTENEAQKMEKEIVTGIENDEKIEIVSGLNTQDLIILPN